MWAARRTACCTWGNAEMKDQREKDHREKDHRDKSRAPILAAGGIVVRNGPEPLVAVVQLRKCDSWVLPKGKLDPGESALAAARREVLEEAGVKVHIHEFLGTMSYDVGERVKVVQFWRMRAVGEPARRLTHDVKAVQWLPLQDAINKLGRSRERTFLESVAPVVAKPFARAPRKARPADEPIVEQNAQPLMPPPATLPSPGQSDVAPVEEAARGDIVEAMRTWFRRGRRKQAA